MKVELAKQLLLREQSLLEQRLELISQDQDWLMENDAYEAEWAAQVMNEEMRVLTDAMKTHSERLLTQTKKTLSRLEEGSFGICSRCYREIEEKRLELLPTTTVCKECK